MFYKLREFKCNLLNDIGPGHFSLHSEDKNVEKVPAVKSIKELLEILHKYTQNKDYIIDYTRFNLKSLFCRTFDFKKEGIMSMRDLKSMRAKEITNRKVNKNEEECQILDTFMILSSEMQTCFARGSGRFMYSSRKCFVRYVAAQDKISS